MLGPSLWCTNVLESFISKMISSQIQFLLILERLKYGRTNYILTLVQSRKKHLTDNLLEIAYENKQLVTYISVSVDTTATFYSQVLIQKKLYSGTTQLGTQPHSISTRRSSTAGPTRHFLKFSVLWVFGI